MATELNWQTWDTTDMSAELTLAYEQYRELNRQAQAARELFEKSFLRDVSLPAGKTLAFGYRFGRLSVAITEASTKSKPAPKGALTRDQLLAMCGQRSI